jgi:hypothetical protein
VKAVKETTVTYQLEAGEVGYLLDMERKCVTGKRASLLFFPCCAVSHFSWFLSEASNGEQGGCSFP